MGAKPSMRRIDRPESPATRGYLARLAMLAFAALSVTGCGSRSLGKVHGKVTVGGVPVPGGTIMFYPADGPGAVGAIGQDGVYTLTTHRSGDGATIGSHKVAIHATSVG